MDRRSFIRATVGGGSAVAIAGCTGDSDTGGTDTPAGVPETDTETDTPEPDPAASLPDPVSVGFPTPALGVWAFPFYPTLEAILAEKDVSLETGVFSGHTPTAGALLQGDIQTGIMSLPALVAAQNEGMPLVAIHGNQEYYGNGLVAQPEFETIADLEGADVAIHAPQGATAAMGFSMALDEWGDVDAVNWQYIFGSSNRVAALESGEVDATIVSLGSTEYVGAEGIGNIVEYAWNIDSLVDAYQGVLVALEPQLDERSDVVQPVIDELQAAYTQTLDGDAGEIVAAGLDSAAYPEFGEETWVSALERLQEVGMWPATKEDALPRDRIESTQEMLVDVGLMDEGAPREYDELVDRRFLE